jgi:hypothetical protein
MFVHMSGTVTPLFLFPHETWAQFPYAATLEGQYIIKNLVLVSAGLVLYPAVSATSTHRALRSVADLSSGSGPRRVIAPTASSQSA